MKPTKKKTAPKPKSKTAKPKAVKHEILHAATVTRRWGKHALQALQSTGHLFRKEGSKPAEYLVLTPIPADMRQYLHDYYSRTVPEALNYAFGEIESLKEELQEWYDNLPESFQNGSKGEELQSAIDELEGIEDPREPYPDKDLVRLFALLPKVVVWPSGNSRSDRGCGAADAANAVARSIKAYQIIAKQRTDKNADDIEMLDDIETVLGDVAGALENISFPGMY